jgi:hypothetical protein
MRSMSRSKLRFALGGLCAFGTLSPSARADEPPSPDVVPQDEAARHAIDRTWLYADDARVAAPMTIIAMTSTSYTNVDSSPFRVGTGVLPTKYSAFDANTAQPGLMVAAGGELGLFSHVSIMALGQFGVGGVNGVTGGAVAALRVQLLPASFTHLHLALSGGYLRESWEGPVYDDDVGRWNPGNPNGDNGMWFQMRSRETWGDCASLAIFTVSMCLRTGATPSMSWSISGQATEWQERFAPALSGSVKISRKPSLPARKVARVCSSALPRRSSF